MPPQGNLTEPPNPTTQEVTQLRAVPNQPAKASLHVIAGRQGVLHPQAPDGAQNDFIIVPAPKTQASTAAQQALNQPPPPTALINVNRAEAVTLFLPTVTPSTQNAPDAEVTDLAERRRHHKRATWRRRGKRTLIGAAATVVTVAAAWLVGFSPYLVLDAQNINLQAADDTLVDLGAAQEILLAHTGTPLVRVRPGAIREAIAALPAVQDVQVSRVWPHGLTVNVESRQPVAAISTPDGLMLIDADAVTLVPTTDRGELPLLEVPMDDALVVTSALAVFDELPSSIQRQLRNISATTIDDITTYLTTGQVIRWGSSEQLKLKAATVLALLDASPNTRYFDVSSPAVPITR